MKDFDLEWFNSKTLNKQISIESVHTEDGLLEVKLINLIINDCEIEYSKWGGCYILKINDGFMQIYFNECKQSQENGYSHILQMFRENELVVDILLPEGDNWEDDREVGFVQY